jgi:hypothetical protein
VTAFPPRHWPPAPVLLRPRPPAKFERVPAVVLPQQAQRIAGLLLEWRAVWAKHGLTEDAEAAGAVAALLRPLTKPVRLKQNP